MYCSNFSNKANSHIPKYIQDKSYAIFAVMLRKRSCSVCQKSFVPVTGLEGSNWKILVSVTEISLTGPAWLHMRTHRNNFYEEKSGEARSRKPSQPGWPGSSDEEALKKPLLSFSFIAC